MKRYLKSKKVFAMLITIAMMISLIPLTVSAASSDEIELSFKNPPVSALYKEDLIFSIDFEMNSYVTDSYRMTTPHLSVNGESLSLAEDDFKYTNEVISVLDPEGTLDGYVVLHVPNSLCKAGQDLNVEFSVSGSIVQGQGDPIETTVARTTIHLFGPAELTFDANGGVCDTTSMMTDEDGYLLDELPDATMEGATFDGWCIYDEADGEYFDVDDGDAFLADATLYAKWILDDLVIDIGTPEAGKTVGDYNTFSIVSPALRRSIDWQTSGRTRNAVEQDLYWFDFVEDISEISSDSILSSDTKLEAGQKYIIITHTFAVNNAFFFVDDEDCSVDLSCGSILGVISFPDGDIGACYFAIEIPKDPTYAVTVTNGKATVSGVPVETAAKDAVVSLIADEAPNGKVFDKWEVVSGSVTLKSAASTTTTFTMPAEKVAVKATYKDAPTPDPTEYKITAGAGSSYTKGSKNPLTIKCDGALDLFTGIEVDGKAVSADNYTVVSGSTILTFNISYLEALTDGEHKIKFIYKDGLSNVAVFNILPAPTPTPSSPSPKTGDVADLWMTPAAMALIFAGFVAFGIFERKRKYDK